MSTPFILPIAAIFLGLPATAASTSSVVPDSVRNEAIVLVGKVRPTDGDSLRMGDKRIRLFGIDAPESSQKCTLQGEDWACGRAARKALERTVKGKTLTCTVRDMDRGRYVSVCASEGRDVNADMVRRGWAVAYTRYSRDYAQQEIAAQNEKRGLWRSKFVRPHDWRASRRVLRIQRAQAQKPPSSDCPIKGNISRSGAKIFHTPGQAYYTKTHINAGQGERWFCTAQEAVNAGWRAAKR